MTAALIQAQAVDVVIDGSRILDGVSLEVFPGEILALVGPNGAGKSTLLAVLSGDRRPTGGSVSFGGRSVTAMKPLELARLRAVLTQENTVTFPFRVREVVEMGRSPWARTPQAEDDGAAVAAALAETDVSHLADRRYTTLSGGEKARASLSRVLAQRTATVFLDEPTAALDLRHQEDTMRNARRLASGGAAVVVVLHELSLAGAYADRIALVSGGRLVKVGTPAEVLTAELIRQVYGLEVEILSQKTTGRPIVLPLRDPRSESV
jgi:iron complex transport system ATP-binding protein